MLDAMDVKKHSATIEYIETQAAWWEKVATLTGATHLDRERAWLNVVELEEAKGKAIEAMGAARLVRRRFTSLVLVGFAIVAIALLISIVLFSG